MHTMWRKDIKRHQSKIQQNIPIKVKAKCEMPIKVSDRTAHIITYVQGCLPHKGSAVQHSSVKTACKIIRRNYYL